MEKENENSEEKQIVNGEEQEIIKEETDKEKLSVEQNEEKEENSEEIKEKVDEAKREEEEIVKEDNNVEEPTKERSNNSKKVIIIIISILVILLLFLSTIFAIININNNNVIKGVFIEEIDVSNLDKDSLSNLVNEKINNIEDIEMYYGEYSTIIKPEDIGLEINGNEAIKSAISIGKSNNIILDNYSILKAKLFKTKLDINITISEEKLKETIKNIQAEIPEAMKEYSYEVEDDKLVITKGKSGKIIDEEILKQRIIENIKKQFNGNNESVDIPTKYAEPSEIDIEKIYSEIYKEAKDAYIVEEPFELHKEEEGIDFAITIEEAKEILKEEKETYTIPLQITKPRIAVKDLGDKLFKQTLSKYTTIYDAGNTNRASNIALAAKTINGTILLPGETFSYNGKLGNTTKEKGYKEGGAYVGGKVVQAYGGGICQVSTTLYNAVLYANLGIVERYNHSYAVSYVPAGRDATVSYGGKDFKFKNTRSYPIKIVANAKNGVVSVSIAGIKEEKEYEIELTSTVLSTTPCTTVYENNSNLAEGQQKVIQKGHSGLTSIAYKIVKYNGKTISKTVLSKDTYKPMNKIVQVGTKKAETQPSTTTPTVPANTETVQTPTEPETTTNQIDNNTTV